MRTAAAVRGLLILAVLVGASGCGGDSTKHADPSSSGPSSAPATTSPTGSPSTPGSARPFPADTSADDGGHGSGNGLGLTDVRVGRHPGFDRVVFELGGTGTPGWRVEYTTTPRADGSGARVRLKGTVFLQVVLRGVGLPDDVGIPPFGNSRTRIPGTGTHGIAEVAPGAVFEGDQQAFIGLTGAQRPFRAFALSDPARVVVDVQDD